MDVERQVRKTQVARHQPLNASSELLNVPFQSMQKFVLFLKHRLMALQSRGGAGHSRVATTPHHRREPPPPALIQSK